MANDPPKNPYAAYGKKSHKNDLMIEIMRPQNLSGLADKFNDAKEAKYASAVREPLG